MLVLIAIDCFPLLFIGLSVAYLSGRKGLGGPGCYSQDDVDALRALAEEPGIVDLFLTYPLFHFNILFNIY